MTLHYSVQGGTFSLVMVRDNVVLRVVIIVVVVFLLPIYYSCAFVRSTTFLSMTIFVSISQMPLFWSFVLMPVFVHTGLGWHATVTSIEVTPTYRIE